MNRIGQRILMTMAALALFFAASAPGAFAQEYPLGPVPPGAPVLRPMPHAPVLLGPGGIAQAGPRAPRLIKPGYRGPVDVRMMVIHANSTTQGFDQEILHLKKHLEFLNYPGFRLLFRNDMMLMPQTTRSIGLFDGKVIEVTLNSVTEEKAVLRVRMINPKQPGGVALDTTVSVTRKGTFFIGGPKYQGGVLFLPITAWY